MHYQEGIVIDCVLVGFVSCCCFIDDRLNYTRSIANLLLLLPLLLLLLRLAAAAVAAD